LAAVIAANIRNTLTGVPVPEPVESAIVSPNFFRVLGVTPRLGRDFGDQDARDMKPCVLRIDAGRSPAITDCGAKAPPSRMAADAGLKPRRHEWLLMWR
jgi:hypothetical protein